MGKPSMFYTSASGENDVFVGRWFVAFATNVAEKLAL
jgi:hypothetical protein